MQTAARSAKSATQYFVFMLITTKSQIVPVGATLGRPCNSQNYRYVPSVIAWRRCHLFLRTK